MNVSDQTNNIGEEMNIDGLVILSQEITSTEDLTSGFQELFNSPEAKVKGVVYFFMSKKPVPRVFGESNILYIGKTKQTIRQRYFQYSSHLATGKNEQFYKHIIKYYGGLQMGYICSDEPREKENELFKEYYEEYLEFPPKSKVG